jgi:hypothetical protein
MSAPWRRTPRIGLARHTWLRADAALAGVTVLNPLTVVSRQRGGVDPAGPELAPAASARRLSTLIWS